MSFRLGLGMGLKIKSPGAGGGVPELAATGTFTMTQISSNDAKRVYQRLTETGGGQNKGQGTIPITIGSALAGTVVARCRASDGTTILQAPWEAATIANGATSVNITGVDARLGWFYLDLKDVTGSWQNGTVLVGMGRVVFFTGQSLAVRLVHGYSAADTNASLGITIDPNCSVFAPRVDSLGYSETWQAPADGGNYNSTFCSEFLGRQIDASGVNCALVGHAVGGTSLARYFGGTDVVNALTRCAGFEAAIIFVGHTDSAEGAFEYNFQSGLDLAFTRYASYNARGTDFSRVVMTIPNITSGWGTIKTITDIRRAGSNYCDGDAAAQYVQPQDITLYDGVHENNLGAYRLAWHVHRAFRGDFGLSGTDKGPEITAVSRASSSADIVLTITHNDGDDLVISGTPYNRFAVYAAGTYTSPLTVSSLTKDSATQLTLTLSSAPADDVALDVYFGAPHIGTISDIIRDNATDGDGITIGRELVTNVDPLRVDAPDATPPVITTTFGITLTPTSVTYAAGATGFGDETTGGRLTAAGSLTNLPPQAPWAVDFWFSRSGAPASLLCLLGGDKFYLHIDATGKIKIFDYANSATTTITASSVCDGSRHHFAMSVGTDDVKRFFLDGALVKTLNVTDNKVGNKLEIRSFLGGFVWDGTLDELAIWKANKYTSSFTAPSAPYDGSESDLLGLWHLDSNGDPASISV